MGPSSAKGDWSKDVPCKNVLIYGFCKYEKNGCGFQHPVAPNSSKPRALATSPKPSSSTVPATPEDTSFKKKFNLGTPSFTPSSNAVGSLTNRFSTMSPKLSDIPTFVPSKPAESADRPANPYKSSANNSEVFFAPKRADQPDRSVITMDPISAVAASAVSSYPLMYHLYSNASSPGFESLLRPNERSISDLFIDEDLRKSIQRKNEACLNPPPLDSQLPDTVNEFHSLVELDGFMSNESVYRATSNHDGKLYALRRIKHFRLESEKSIMNVKKWEKIVNANIAKVHQAFTTRAFGESMSLVVVYDFHPFARTLVEKHSSGCDGNPPQLITEQVLWNYMVQLTNAIAAIHNSDLAMRGLDISKVITTSKGKIRLSNCAVTDIIQGFEEDIEEAQKQDVLDFGMLLFDLAKGPMYSEIRANPAASPLQLLEKSKFSADFKTALRFLLDEGEKSIFEFQALIAPCIMGVVNDLQTEGDHMEAQISKELENSRLFRLMCKIEFACERCEYTKGSEMWTERDIRYPLKLFKDFVFHQVDEAGKPVTDLFHVLCCLNKLDAGIEEKILLVTEDEKISIIVSYKELKEMIEKGFKELR